MATEIPFITDFSCDYGVMETVTPGIRRIVANNPSAFTFTGTGTYVIGHGQVAVIDPGPDLADHVAALLAALEGEEVSHILVTHTHIDHSPAAAALQDATGAMTFAFGPHGRSGGAGDSPTMEEGGDHDFIPDVEVRDGDVIEGDGWTVECLHTPGHTSNHTCFALSEEKALFTGDHVMGWSTTVISPPDGDMALYLENLSRLLERDEAVFYPTHGAPITEPRPFVEALIGHRRDREAQIMDCLGRGIGTIAAMVDDMYAGLNPKLIPAARRSVFAHMVHMTGDGRVACEGPPSVTSEYRLP